MPFPAVSCVSIQGMPGNPAWKLVGKRPNGGCDDVDFGDHIGRVSTVLSNGCAFVDCPEIKAKHKRDAYIHSNVMEQCGLVSGDKISFVVHINSSGAPQVSAPLWKHVGESNLHAKNGMQETDSCRDDASTTNSVAGETRGRDDEYSQGNSHYKRRESRGRDDGYSRGNSRNKSRGKESSSWWDSKEGDDFRSSGSNTDRDYKTHSTAEDGDLCFGHVVMVNADGQFAMVSCEDLDYKKDVYVHRTTADLHSLRVDDAVAFKLHVNRRGSPQASTPFWKLSSRHRGKRHTQIGKYRGKVCKITSSGNAFVECPELAGENDRDVFVHETLARECCLEEGDEVAFCAHHGHTGQPQLSTPCWKLSIPGRTRHSSDRRDSGRDSGHSPHDRQGRGWHNSHWSGDTSWKRGWDSSRSTSDGQPALPAPATQGGDPDHVLPPWEEQKRSHKDLEAVDEDVLDVEWKPEGFYVGRVNETSSVKGRSMVRCLDWSDRQDVYVHKSVAEPGAISVGDIVAFQIHLNAKGQPQASAPFWKQVGWRPKNKPLRFGKYQGLVARLLSHGCSFLDCKEVSETFGRDAYVHHAVMKQCDLVEGNLIAFDVHVSSAGNPQVSAPCWICCSDDKLMRDRLPEIPSDVRRGRSRERSRGHSREDRLPEIPSDTRRGRSRERSRGHSREDIRRRSSRQDSKSRRKDSSVLRGHGSSTSEEVDGRSSLPRSKRRRDKKEELPPLKRIRRNQESNQRKESQPDCRSSSSPSPAAAPRSVQDVKVRRAGDQVQDVKVRRAGDQALTMSAKDLLANTVPGEKQLARQDSPLVVRMQRALDEDQELLREATASP